MKDKVLIEEMGKNKVGLYTYDELDKSIDGPIEVCTIEQAHSNYEIIGEYHIDNGVSLYDSEYEEEEEGDYTLEDFNLVEEDD